MYLRKSHLLAIAALLTLASTSGGQGTAIRIPIADARTPIPSLPFTITEPGSYYVTQHLEAPAGGTGIEVAASLVTIDLNGFTLLGTAGVGDAIYKTSAGYRLSIKNGHIHDWPGWAVNISAPGQTLENVSVGSCDLGGFLLGETSIVTNCMLRYVGGVGIQAGPHSILRDCIVNNSGSDGFALEAGTITQNCIATGAGGMGFQATGYNVVLENCMATSAADHGIRLRRGAVARGCTAAENAGIGFHLDFSVAESCNANQNTLAGFDVNNSVVSKAVAHGNGGWGFEVGDLSSLATCSATTHAPNSGYWVKGVTNALRGTTTPSEFEGGSPVYPDGYWFAPGSGGNRTYHYSGKALDQGGGNTFVSN